MSYHEGSNWQANKEDKKEPLYPSKQWRRYRFHTKSVDDWRPLIYNLKYPCWCSGYSLSGTIDEPEYDSAIIIAYLPISEDLKKYWDDAFDVEYTDHETIEFSDRFPKPKSFVE